MFNCWPPVQILGIAKCIGVNAYWVTDPSSGGALACIYALLLSYRPIKWGALACMHAYWVTDPSSGGHWHVCMLTELLTHQVGGALACIHAYWVTDPLSGGALTYMHAYWVTDPLNGGIGMYAHLLSYWPIKWQALAYMHAYWVTGPLSGGALVCIHARLLS